MRQVDGRGGTEVSPVRYAYYTVSGLAASPNNSGPNNGVRSSALAPTGGLNLGVRQSGIDSGGRGSSSGLGGNTSTAGTNGSPLRNGLNFAGNGSMGLNARNGRPLAHPVHLQPTSHLFQCRFGVFLTVRISVIGEKTVGSVRIDDNLGAALPLFSAPLPFFTWSGKI